MWIHAAVLRGLRGFKAAGSGLAFTLAFLSGLVRCNKGLVANRAVQIRMVPDSGHTFSTLYVERMGECFVLFPCALQDFVVPR